MSSFQFLSCSFGFLLTSRWFCLSYVTYPGMEPAKGHESGYFRRSSWWTVKERTQQFTLAGSQISADDEWKWYLVWEPVIRNSKFMSFLPEMDLDLKKCDTPEDSIVDCFVGTNRGRSPLDWLFQSGWSIIRVEDKFDSEATRLTMREVLDVQSRYDQNQDGLSYGYQLRRWGYDKELIRKKKNRSTVDHWGDGKQS